MLYEAHRDACCDVPWDSNPLHGTRFLVLNFLGHTSELLGLSGQGKSRGYWLSSCNCVPSLSYLSSENQCSSGTHQLLEQSEDDTLVCRGNLRVRVAPGYLYLWKRACERRDLATEGLWVAGLGKFTGRICGTCCPCHRGKVPDKLRNPLTFNQDISLCRYLNYTSVWDLHVSFGLYNRCFFHSWIMMNKSDFSSKTPSLRLSWEGPTILAKL